MRHIDLFSGIGGFALAASWVWGDDYEPVAFCEIEPDCQKHIADRWPGVPIIPDIRNFQGSIYAGSTNLITAGFPCQGISVAGPRGGLEDQRSGLWSHRHRVIGDVRPQVAVLENSANLLSGDGGRWFGKVLGDLAAIGYDAQWHCIPATAVGAWHERDRVWIISYPHPEYGEKGMGDLEIRPESLRAAHQRNRNGVWLQAARPAPGVVDGISDPLVYRRTVEGYGNAIVPQVAAELLSAIKPYIRVTP